MKANGISSFRVNAQRNSLGDFFRVRFFSKFLFNFLNFFGTVWRSQKIYKNFGNILQHSKNVLTFLEFFGMFWKYFKYILDLLKLSKTFWFFFRNFWNFLDFFETFWFFLRLWKKKKFSETSWNFLGFFETLRSLLKLPKNFWNTLQHSKNFLTLLEFFKNFQKFFDFQKFFCDFLKQFDAVKTADFSEGLLQKAQINSTQWDKYIPTQLWYGGEKIEPCWKRVDRHLAFQFCGVRGACEFFL